MTPEEKAVIEAALFLYEYWATGAWRTAAEEPLYRALRAYVAKLDAGNGSSPLDRGGGPGG